MNAPALEVRRTLVWKRLGMPDPPADAAMVSDFERAYAATLKALAPATSARKAAVDRWTPDGVSLEGGVTFGGRLVAGMAERAHAVVAMAVTVGPGVDDLIDDLNRRGDSFAMLVADAAASVAAEELIGWAHGREKASAAANGDELGRRISPGYGDFDLSCQRQLLPLGGGDALGIALTEGYMMVPRKSVTALAAVKRR